MSNGEEMFRLAVRKWRDEGDIFAPYPPAALWNDLHNRGIT
jgi:hypothetical protein